MSELKPCAHCGSRGELVMYYDFYHVNCTNDDCVEHYDDGMVYRGTGAWYGSIADAIEAWNTRATLGGGECELVYGENDHGDDGWWCQSCGGWFAASFRHTGRNNIIEPRFCQHCGKAVKR